MIYNACCSHLQIVYVTTKSTYGTTTGHWQCSMCPTEFIPKPPTEPVNPTCGFKGHKFSHCDCEVPTPMEPTKSESKYDCCWESKNRGVPCPTHGTKPDCCKGFALGGVLFHDCKEHRPYCAKEWPCHCHKTDNFSVIKAAQKVYSNPEAGKENQTPTIIGKFQCYDLDSICRDIAHLEQRMNDTEMNVRGWRKSLLDWLDAFTDWTAFTLEYARKGKQGIKDLRSRFA